MLMLSTSKWSDSFSSSKWIFSWKSDSGSRMKRCAMCCASSLSMPATVQNSALENRHWPASVISHWTHYNQRCCLHCRQQHNVVREVFREGLIRRVAVDSLYLHRAAVCWSLHRWSAQCHCISHHSRRGSCQSNHTSICWSWICCFSVAAKKQIHHFKEAILCSVHITSFVCSSSLF